MITAQEARIIADGNIDDFVEKELFTFKSLAESSIRKAINKGGRKTTFVISLPIEEQIIAKNWLKKYGYYVDQFEREWVLYW